MPSCKEVRSPMSTLDQIVRTDTPCVILAGGQARRFGSNKALALLHGERIIDTLIARLDLQTTAPIAISALKGSALDDLKHPILTDHFADSIGPLAGIHAAMCWARDQGYEEVVTTPVDTPLLPLSFIQKLIATGAPSIATFEDRQHVVHGLWPTRLIEQLVRSIERGTRSARDWVRECDAVECVFNDPSGQDPFFNINTPEDLITLEKTHSDRDHSL